jgi:hypothetical protein
LRRVELLDLGHPGLHVAALEDPATAAAFKLRVKELFALR